MVLLNSFCLVTAFYTNFPATYFSHLMRVWYFSSSVNSFFKRVCAAIQWGYMSDFCRTLRLFPYFMCANSEGCGEHVRMHMLAWAFAGRLCDKYHNLMSWLKYSYFIMSYQFSPLYNDISVLCKLNNTVVTIWWVANIKYSSTGSLKLFIGHR